MKFTCERDDLLNAVQFASRAISNRATLPVLSGLRIDARDDGSVTTAATDLEITMQTGFAAKVDEPGRLVVPGRLLGEVARSLASGRVTVVGGEGELELGFGRGQFRVKTMAAEDYPGLPTEEAEDPTAVEINVDGQDLATGLAQVITACSTDESRQVLTGVLWEIDDAGVTLVATDSYRLAVRKLGASVAEAEPRRVILPARALGELARVLQGSGRPVRARVRENLVAFVIGGASEGRDESIIASRFIEGEFPNYRQLIPQGYTNKLTVSKSVLADVIKRVGLLAQNNLPIKLRLSEEMEVSAHTPDVGEGQEIVDAQYEGEPLVIAFNPHFLNDGVTAIQNENVTLSASDGLKPAILEGEGEASYTYLLMPVRLS